MSNQEYSIAVLGSSESKKSALLLRFVKDDYDPEYIPTIEDYLSKKIAIDKKEYAMKIIDTAGQSEMKGITEIYMKEAQAFIIVYSVMNQLSFNEVDEFRGQVLNISNENRDKIVLVGTECEKENHNISKEQGKKKAAEWGNVPFFETSVKKNINVQEPFIAALKLILNSKTEEKSVEKDEKNGHCNIS